jgi:hypothetical protein
MDIKDQKIIELSKDSLHAYMSVLRLALMLQADINSINERYKTYEEVKEKNGDCIRLLEAYDQVIRALVPLLDTYKIEDEETTSEYAVYINNFRTLYKEITQCDCPACDGTLEQKMKAQQL